MHEMALCHERNTNERPISREVFFIQGIPLAEQMLKQGKWFEGESALGNVFLHMVAFQTQF